MTMLHLSSPLALARRCLQVAACALLALTASPPCMAQLMYAYTAYAPAQPSRLISFNVGSSATLLSNVLVTGLGANERLKGIDIRPSTGQLYAVAVTSGSNAARVLTINTQTGAATQVAPSSTTLPASQFFGMSFAPGLPETIRMISYNTGDNQRLNAITGALISNDSALSYVATDPNYFVPPIIANIAYTNSSIDARATTLYAIDTRGTNSVLARIGNVNDSGTSANFGNLTTIGSLGITPATVVGGFDIQAGTGYAFAALSTNGTSSNLYLINLTTGAAFFLAPIGDSTTLVDGLAVTSNRSACLDLDGDGLVLPTTDGLMWLRALMGMTGTAVTSGALPTPAPPRATWEAIQAFLNNTCGTSFAP